MMFSDHYLLTGTQSISFMYKWVIFLFQVESVDLALKLLDGYELRGHKLHVERAKFQMKGNYDPNLKPKKRKKKEKEKLKKIQEK
jgi:HIV Tat-specific factor 1